MDETACRTQEHCAGHVVCMGSPKHTSPFCQDSSCGMLTEDFSLRFSWYAQERTAKATTNTPSFCHQKGCMMDTAQQIVTQLAHGDFAAVERRLADRIKSIIPVGTIQATWQGLEKEYGEIKGQGKTSAVQTQDVLVQVVTCVFERASLDVNIVLNDAGEIIGLTVTPVGTVEQQANATYEPPPYAQPERFQEHEVQIGHGKWVLPGTVSIPQGDGPFAAVLLVRGVVPCVSAQTVPPHQHIPHLAWGVSLQGIAVLRSEQRTKVYAAQLGSERDTLTVKEEVIDDALEAVALLRD